MSQYMTGIVLYVCPLSVTDGQLTQIHLNSREHSSAGTSEGNEWPRRLMLTRDKVLRLLSNIPS